MPQLYVPLNIWTKNIYVSMRNLEDIINFIKNAMRQIMKRIKLSSPFVGKVVGPCASLMTEILGFFPK